MNRKLALLAVALLVAPAVAMAQDTVTPMPAPDAPEGHYKMRAPGLPAQGVMKRSPAAAPTAPVIPKSGPDLGAWWKNSAIVQEIGLSEQQVSQIEQTFFDHRLKLIDLKATVEREETRLQPLMEAAQVDEARIGPQIDKVLAARSALEKANVMMMLSIRKVLTVDQWKKLESIRHHREGRSRLKMEQEQEQEARRRYEMMMLQQEEEARRRRNMMRREPPIADASGRIRVEGEVQQSQLVHQAQPTYPDVARQARIQGTVRLQAVIAKDGSVAQLEVVHGHPLLVQSAMEAVRQWRYQPTLHNGEPVEVITTVDVTFRMTD